MGYKLTNLNQKEKQKLINAVIDLRDNQGLLWEDIKKQVGLNERTIKKLYLENR